MWNRLSRYKNHPPFMSWWFGVMSRWWLNEDGVDGEVMIGVDSVVEGWLTAGGEGGGGRCDRVAGGGEIGERGENSNNVDEESQKIGRQAQVMISDAEEYLISEDPVKQGRMEETENA
ncbi:hypothetical protein Tco_0972485 [Tanacetum coccineum]